MSTFGHKYSAKSGHIKPLMLSLEMHSHDKSGPSNSDAQSGKAFPRQITVLSGTAPHYNFSSFAVFTLCPAATPLNMPSGRPPGTKNSSGHSAGGFKTGAGR